jgi:hypothetical protein
MFPVHSLVTRAIAIAIAMAMAFRAFLLFAA